MWFRAFIDSDVKRRIISVGSIIGLDIEELVEIIICFHLGSRLGHVNLNCLIVVIKGCVEQKISRKRII